MIKFHVEFNFWIQILVLAYNQMYQTWMTVVGVVTAQRCAYHRQPIKPIDDADEEFFEWVTVQQIFLSVSLLFKTYNWSVGGGGGQMWR